MLDLNELGLVREDAIKYPPGTPGNIVDLWGRPVEAIINGVREGSIRIALYRIVNSTVALLDTDRSGCIEGPRDALIQAGRSLAFIDIVSEITTRINRYLPKERTVSHILPDWRVFRRHYIPVSELNHEGYHFQNLLCDPVKFDQSISAASFLLNLYRMPEAEVCALPVGVHPRFPELLVEALLDYRSAAELDIPRPKPSGDLLATEKAQKAAHQLVDKLTDRFELIRKRMLSGNRQDVMVISNLIEDCLAAGFPTGWVLRLINVTRPEEIIALYRRLVSDRVIAGPESARLAEYLKDFSNDTRFGGQIQNAETIILPQTNTLVGVEVDSHQLRGALAYLNLTGNDYDLKSTVAESGIKGNEVDIQRIQFNASSPLRFNLGIVVGGQLIIMQFDLRNGLVVDYPRMLEPADTPQLQSLTQAVMQQVPSLLDRLYDLSDKYTDGRSLAECVEAMRAVKGRAQVYTPTDLAARSSASGGGSPKGISERGSGNGEATSDHGERALTLEFVFERNSRVAHRWNKFGDKHPEDADKVTAALKSGRLEVEPLATKGGYFRCNIGLSHLDLRVIVKASDGGDTNRRVYKVVDFGTHQELKNRKWYQ